MHDKGVDAESEVYVFSIIMATYNMEDYVAEALDSIVGQTFPLSKTQVIIVDDGSTDNTGMICSEYTKKYPASIFYVRKSNGGVASARNEGLKYIRGRYVNFMDPDDRMDTNVLKTVHDYFVGNEDNVDVVTIPILLFGAKTGEYWQNFIFEKGTRNIDLWKEHDVMISHTNSSFVLKDSIGDIRFDDRITDGEDMKFLLQVLARKMTLGTVTGCHYQYRQREGSLINITHNDKRWYTNYLVHVERETEEYYRCAFGEVPRFVQYVLMSNLQWRFKDYTTPNNIATEDVFEDYKRQLFDSVKSIDDDIILKQKNIDNEIKCFILCKKYDAQPTAKMSGGRLCIFVNGKYIGAVTNQRVTQEFIRINGNRVSLDCCVRLYGLDHTKEIEPFVKVNGKIVRPSHKKIVFENDKFGEHPSFKIRYVFDFKIKDSKRNKISNFGMTYDGIEVPFKKIKFGYFFPIDDSFRNSYYTTEGWICRFENNSLRIQRTNALGIVKSELKFDKELIRTDIRQNVIAGFARPVIKLMRKIKSKKHWLISDRVDKADDNGEALFRYLVENGIEKPVFAISKNCHDHSRLSKIGRTTDFFSTDYYYKYLTAAAIVSSNNDDYMGRPFKGHQYRDLIYEIRHVFIQHGITKDDASGWLNRYRSGLDAIVSAAKPERDSFLEYNYHFDSDRIWLTGFPRYDKLVDDKKKIIAVMPTWRKYLNNKNVDGKWSGIKGFEKTDYFQFYNALINNNELMSLLKTNGYRLLFVPHPNMQKYIDMFDKNECVTLEQSNEISYSKIFSEASLLVTDYSSVSFDFAYLHKPVIYCQFDHNMVWIAKHVGVKGYYDYKENGFGDVTDTVESTVHAIAKYISNGCEMPDVYKRRVSEFFAFNDRNNSKRVYEKVIGLLNSVK